MRCVASSQQDGSGILCRRSLVAKVPSSAERVDDILKQLGEMLDVRAAAGAWIRPVDARVMERSRRRSVLHRVLNDGGQKSAHGQDPHCRINPVAARRPLEESLKDSQ